MYIPPPSNLRLIKDKEQLVNPGIYYYNPVLGDNPDMDAALLSCVKKVMIYGKSPYAGYRQPCIDYRFLQSILPHRMPLEIQRFLDKQRLTQAKADEVSDWCNPFRVDNYKLYLWGQKVHCPPITDNNVYYSISLFTELFVCFQAITDIKKEFKHIKKPEIKNVHMCCAFKDFANRLEQQTGTKCTYEFEDEGLRVAQIQCNPTITVLKDFLNEMYVLVKQTLYKD